MKMKDESAPGRGRKPAKIGPSDSSDTISDRPGEPDTDSDAALTGERAAAGRDARENRSVEFDTDRVVGEDEAGLGDGLDEAEEARLRKPKP